MLQKKKKFYVPLSSASRFGMSPSNVLASSARIWGVGPGKTKEVKINNLKIKN